MGSALTVWVAWQIRRRYWVAIRRACASQLGFRLCLSAQFYGIDVRSLRDRPTVVAALTGGIMAVLAKGLPYNIGLVLATFLGIAAGYLVENRETAS
ncbi:MAG: hypothetical protein IPJ46_10905 [Anaerolineales bacterium]|nr:hypothetical protein [Anaerolineales bacterium]